MLNYQRVWFIHMFIYGLDIVIDICIIHFDAIYYGHLWLQIHVLVNSENNGMDDGMVLGINPFHCKSAQLDTVGHSLNHQKGTY